MKTGPDSFSSSYGEARAFVSRLRLPVESSKH